jgi:putative hydroxymethylpyrimidine transport system permease protein
VVGRGSAALRAYGPALAIIIAAIALWELLVRALDVPDYLVPAPSQVARTLATDWDELGPSTWVTLREVLAGFANAVVAGIAIAVAIHLSPTLKHALYPILIASQSIPTVVLAPILVILLGYGVGPKLAIVALFCFFPIVVNGVDGLESTDPEYARMMRTLHGSRRAIFRRVEFPSALPFIFSGARIAATYAAIGAVFGEWAGSDAGLGYLLQTATHDVGQTDLVFASVLLLTVMALALFALVRIVERLVVPWTFEDGETRKR